MKNDGVVVSKAIIINKGWLDDVFLDENKSKCISIVDILGEKHEFSLTNMYALSSTVLRKEKGNDLFSSVYKYYSVSGSATIVVESEDDENVSTSKDGGFIQHYIDTHVIPSL